MATASLVPVSEYLNTSYRPDCEYIDGELLERNLGETEHGWIQGSIIHYMLNRRAEWGITAIPELRVQVKATRFRVPDITVIKGRLPKTRILTDPPFLCIEILSCEDSMYNVQERMDDYLAFGIPNIWVVNPRTRRGFIYTSEGMHEAKDGVLRTVNPNIELPLSELPLD